MDRRSDLAPISLAPELAFGDWVGGGSLVLHSLRPLVHRVSSMGARAELAAMHYPSAPLELGRVCIYPRL